MHWKMEFVWYYYNEILKNMTNDHQSLSIVTEFIIIVIRLNFLFVIFHSYLYAWCVVHVHMHREHNNNKKYQKKIEMILHEIRNRFNHNWLGSTWRHTLILIETWDWKYYFILFYLRLISFLNRIQMKITHTHIQKKSRMKKSGKNKWMQERESIRR